MKTRIIAIIILLTGLSPSLAMAIDLQDSMVAAYQYNNQLKAQQSDLLSSQEQIPEAYAGFMPQAGFSGDVKRGGSYNLLTQGIGSGTLYHSDNSRDLIVTQPLFDGGGTIAQVKHAYNDVASATSNLQVVEGQVLLNAITAHMEVVRTVEILDLSRENEEVLKEQLDSSQQRFKLGEATKTDVSQSEARYSRAISDRTKAEGDLAAAIANYKNYTGRAGDKSIDDAAGFIKPQVAGIKLPDTVDQALDLSFKNNPSLTAQIYQEKASENQISVAYANLSPSLSLRGVLARETDSYSVADIHDNESTVEVDLNFPLYQGGAEYARIRAAKKDRDANKFLVEQRKDNLRANVTKSWEDTLTARASIKSYSDAVKAAKVALDGVRKEQAVGARTVLDVLNAEQELFQEKINLATAERDEVVAVYSLKFYIGELTAKALSLPVKVFNTETALKRTQFKMIGF